MLRYYITDRLQAGGEEHMLRHVRRAAQAGVDFIQVREKDLDARALLSLVERVLAACSGTPARVLVNSRLDVALAAGAQGVHLPDGSISAQTFRRITPPGFLIAASCHSLEELAQPGLDFVTFSPVFATPSKAQYGAPQGLDRLREACRLSPVPVIALGGITYENASQCLEAGAAGIAAIRLFQPAP